MPEEKKVEKKTVAAAPAPAPAPAPKSAGADKDSNLMAALGYIIGLLAILLFFIKKEDRFVRFHALQAVLFSLSFVVLIIVVVIAAIAVNFVPGVGQVLSCVFTIIELLMALAFLAADLYAAYMAYQGIWWEIPVIGGIAKSHA